MNSPLVSEFVDRRDAEAVAQITGTLLNAAAPPRVEVVQRSTGYAAMVNLDQAMFGPESAWANCTVLCDPVTKRPERLAYTTYDPFECDGQSGVEVYREIDLKGRILVSEIQPT